MLKKNYAGSILVNGSERKIEVSGNPVGRTTIQLDGITVYDKTPFVHKETIEFQPIPGKKAVLRWQQVSVTGVECDVTVDGKTSTLSGLTRDGVLKPVGQEKRREFEVWMAGAALIVFGIVSLVMNYYDLKTGHYWTTLGSEPIALVAGATVCIRPSAYQGLSQTTQKILIVLGVGAMFLFHELFLSLWVPR